MKLYLFIFLFIIAGAVHSQEIKKGKVIIQKFLAASVQNNPAGEDAMRRLTIYLPPGYDEGKQHYPVIYFLHGFTRNDSFYISQFHFDRLLDTAIASGNIHPVIFVIPNSYTQFKGSFYTNSPLTGNWADYIAKDVVQYMDKNFRTLADRNSRGLCGHSMGGNGSIKIAMLYSDVFSAVYALSPARLNWGEGLTANSPHYKAVQSAKNFQELEKNFFALEIADLARTYSPDIKVPPFYIDLPYQYINDSLITDSSAYKKWNANFPINMIDEHVAALKSLRALKMDWGRNDQFKFIPIACMEFSKKLEADSIPHFAEEYIGDHGNKIGGTDGRIYTELLPFFNAYLKFE